MTEDIPFECFPGKLLGALASMPSHQQLVYVVVLLRIYENGGVCPDGVDALARRTHIDKRRVADALQRLFGEGRLHQVEGGISNRKAEQILADREARAEHARSAGAAGGRRSAEKRKGIQGEGSSNPADPLLADAQQTNTLFNLPFDDSGKDSRESGGAGGKPKREPKTRRRLPDDFELGADDWKFADQRGLHGQVVRTMFEAFTNYHRGRGTLMADWRAAWRTWVLNEVRYSQRRGPPGSGGNGAPVPRRDAPSGMVAAAMQYEQPKGDSDDFDAHPNHPSRH